MSQRANRRDFLKTTALTGIGFWIAAGSRATADESPNERLSLASIGIGGKGSSDSEDAAQGTMYAICDVDETRLNVAGEKRFPHAKTLYRFPQALGRVRGQDRRGHGQHARPHPRPGGLDGHADAQALFLPEAADPHALRSAADGQDRKGNERRHPDGQPRHGRFGSAAKP